MLSKKAKRPNPVTGMTRSSTFLTTSDDVKREESPSTRQRHRSGQRRLAPSGVWKARWAIAHPSTKTTQAALINAMSRPPGVALNVLSCAVALLLAFQIPEVSPTTDIRWRRNPAQKPANAEPPTGISRAS